MWDREGSYEFFLREIMAIKQDFLFGTHRRNRAAIYVMLNKPSLPLSSPRTGKLSKKKTSQKGEDGERSFAISFLFWIQANAPNSSINSVI